MDVWIGSTATQRLLVYSSITAYRFTIYFHNWFYQPEERCDNVLSTFRAKFAMHLLGVFFLEILGIGVILGTSQRGTPKKSFYSNKAETWDKQKNVNNQNRANRWT